VADFLTLLALGDKRARLILGELVTYSPSVGMPVTVNGIFDLHASVVDVGEVGIDTAHPRVFLTLSDLPSDPITDTASTFTVRGVVYNQWRCEADGEGGVYIWGNAVV
jgi:hypothetical protein